MSAAVVSGCVSISQRVVARSATKFGAPNPAAVLRRKLLPGQAFRGIQLSLVSSSGRASRAAARRSLAASATAVAAAPQQGQGKPFVPWEGKLSNKFRRTDIKRILILGAGPIVIGQVGLFPEISSFCVFRQGD